MARVLFVVPPLTGHINPTLGLAAELEHRGHEVAWIGHPSAVRPRLPEGACLLPLDEHIADSVIEAVAEERRRARGPAALKLVWQSFFIPLAHGMWPAVEAAARDWRPDLMVVDQHTVGGAIAARRLGIPFATSCSTIAGLVDPLADMPKVQAWLDGMMAELQRSAGLDVIRDPTLSPDLAVCFVARELLGEQRTFAAHHHFVGSPVGAAQRPAEEVDFPWQALDADRPAVLVSLGTVNFDTGARFYRTVIEAFPDPAYTIVLAAPLEMVPNAPAHFVVQSWVPQLSLLKRVSAVVTHAGQNTTTETLLHGLPMVCAPIKDDQPMNAQLVADRGAGLRVRFGRVRAPRLREAVDRVLTEPSFRTSAKRLQAAYQTAGGPTRAADLMEQLLEAQA